MDRQLDRILQKINKLKPQDKRRLWSLLSMAIPHETQDVVEQTTPKRIDWVLQRVAGGVIATGIDGIQPVCFFKPLDDNRDAVREIHAALAKAKDVP